jgi:fused signal recognition particle receptor
MFSFRKSRSKTSDTATKPKAGLLSRLRQGLSKTRKLLNTDIRDLIAGRTAVDEDLLEELENRLLVADLGIDATTAIIDDLRERVKRRELKDPEQLISALRENMTGILAPCSKPLEIPDQAGPFVILMVGVNGVGKTTTIGKLARRLKDNGLSVMLAAGDTFRAAAVEQLQAWGERNDIPVVAQARQADSAAVLYDALESAKARGIDVLIADTAGRLHTQHNLMEELKKVKRVIAKLDPSAPHETMLVVDAGTGQNALVQAQEFDKAMGLTGITLTKLDGTAKGGILLALASKLPIPIRFIGVGESLEDLRVFDHAEFVDALLSEPATRTDESAE